MYSMNLLGETSQGLDIRRMAERTSSQGMNGEYILAYFTVRE